MTAALGSNSQALWYMTRGFGLIDLVLLTATLVMGLTQVVRYFRPGWPRFVVSALHKNISILAVVFLAVHVITAVADTFAPISIASVFIPFVGKYRPLWLGLGALALDLMVALVITSLVRERIGFRTWRALHWTAYLCWPVAILHGLGTGTDAKVGWVLALNVVCIVAGIAAIWWRLALGWTSANAARRGIAVIGTLIVPLIVAGWAVTGPLRPGWAKRAGTPAALLGTSAVRAGTALKVPLSSNFTGSQREATSQGDGTVSLVLIGQFDGGAFQATLNGQGLSGGGVQLTGSQVTLGPTGSAAEYTGQVTTLSGDTLVAVVKDSSGQALNVTIQLTSNERRTIAGTIRVTE